jgi:hypothetical protein
MKTKKFAIYGNRRVNYEIEDALKRELNIEFKIIASYEDFKKYVVEHDESICIIGIDHRQLEIDFKNYPNTFLNDLNNLKFNPFIKKCLLVEPDTSIKLLESCLNVGFGISLTASTGNITISSFGADLINVIGVTSNYTATLTDEYIGVSSASAVTITLPAGVNGRVYIIKDEFGQGSGKITIQPQVGSKVDNGTNYVISVPYQSVQVVFRAGNWWIM